MTTSDNDDLLNEASFYEDSIADEPQDDSEKTVESCDEAVETEMTTVPVAEFEKLKRELDEAKDRGLRALAELENYRARTKRLHDEERKYASADLARAILPIWDNLNLAIGIEDAENNGPAVLAGVKMVVEEFLKVLKNNGIEKIDALHKPFDPNFHESVSFAPSDEYPANTVIYEVKAGFKLHDRVIRAAQVVLASPPTTSSKTETNS